MSVDPLQFKYPHYTPYQYAGNKPVSYIDLDGLEEAKKEEVGGAQSLQSVINIGDYLQNGSVNLLKIPNNQLDTDVGSSKPPTYYMNYQGFWINGDESFGEYVGNIAPSGGQEGYMELTKIKEQYYHKNTSNLFAKTGNALGGDFVEHKPYDKAEENFNYELKGFAIGYGVLKAGGLAFNLLKSAGGSLWKIAPLERGFVYESMMNI